MPPDSGIVPALPIAAVPVSFCVPLLALFARESLPTRRSADLVGGAPEDMPLVLLSVRAPVTVSVPAVTFRLPELVMPPPLSDSALVPLLLIVPELLIAAAPAP